jgi:hypothetical protein
MRRFSGGAGGPLGTLWRAIRTRPVVFLGVGIAVILLDVVLPVVVLSVFRKPYDHFSFNPWLARAPQWVLSPTVPWARKVEFLSDVALFWFIASSPYDAPEWGFSVGFRDVARFLYMGLVFGAYFALWSYGRSTGRIRPAWRGGARGGFTGALLSTVGLFTSPCSVAGCGAPVLPVLGLTFQGLTSGTLAALTSVSALASRIVLVGMTLVVAALAWVVNRRERQRFHPAPSLAVGRPPVRQVAR